MSWDDAQEFIEKLNARSGRKYRLPTEAEWEYAAREGGKKVRFGTGRDTIGPDEANFDASKKYKRSYSRAGKYRRKTVPEGSFSPNGLGLYDMSGNVEEWCSDRFALDYYKSSPRNNPTGPSFWFTWGAGRVVRGGSFSNGAVNMRSARRGTDTPGDRDAYNGARCLRPLEP